MNGKNKFLIRVFSHWQVCCRQGYPSVWVIDVGGICGNGVSQVRAYAGKPGTISQQRRGSRSPLVTLRSVDSENVKTRPQTC